MMTKTSIESIKLSNGRFVNVGHEVTNFGRRCVILGAPVGVGADDCLVVQEISGNDLVPGSTWIAAPKFLA
jgi:predicted phage tail protein